MPTLEVESSPSPAEPKAEAPTELLREMQGLVRQNTRQWKMLIVLEMVAVLGRQDRCLDVGDESVGGRIDARRTNAGAHRKAAVVPIRACPPVT